MHSAGRFLVRFNQVTDALLVALILWLAHALHAYVAARLAAGVPVLGFEWVPSPVPFSQYHWLYLIILPVCPFLLDRDHYYDQSRHRRPGQTVWVLAKNIGLCTLLMSAAAHFLGQPRPSRTVLVLFTVFSVAGLYGKDRLTEAWLRLQAARGRNRRAIVLVGSAERTAEFEALLRAHHAWRIDVVARIEATSESLPQLPDLLYAHPVECVIFADASPSSPEMEKAILACETTGVETWLAADFVNPSVARARLEHFHDRPLLILHTGPQVTWQLAVKRLGDLLGATLGLAVLGPLVMLPIAVVIKLSSPGPVLFSQRRSGLRGRQFTMYKFRSMVGNAETLRGPLEPLNEVSGPVFKMKNDPRVTRFGRFLRRASLDELPQLWSILKGEMSLVGPRPPIPSEVDRYDAWHRRRLSMKPGLTCLWQVSGRSNVPFDEWMRLDLQYIDNWSLWLDLKILLRTIPAVLNGAGAR
jgi:exopolysaccharide biosynthesis polyprenyl glycosylphosphotransferase